MKALFRSVNLIGDGLNIYPALSAWCALHLDWDIDLYTLPESVDMYKAFKLVQVNVISGDDPSNAQTGYAHYDFEFTFGCGRAFSIGDRYKCHISEAYAKMLGLAHLIDKYELRFIPEEEEHEKDLILISPFSRSCAVHSGLPPNKTLPEEKLAPVIAMLQRRGKIGVLGSANDRLQHITLDETEYYTGLPLNKVALMLRDCKYLVTIDNGIAHLAATQKTKSAVLYPACLGMHWITPLNPNAMILHLDPARVEVTNLVWSIRSILDQF